MSLTVLMPIKHHHPAHLEAALASLFAQTRGDWRLLAIVEPQDAQRMASVLAGALSDARVRLVANRGRRLAGAFNTGMHEAGTDFVAILLADDLWREDAVDVLASAIAEHPDADFFHTGRVIVDGQGQPISSPHLPPDRVVVGDFRSGSPVKHLLCWRRSLALAAGGMDETLNDVGPDDWDFPWTMAEHGARFHAIPACLYVYRDHRDTYRLTTHLPRSVHLAEIRRILEKHGTPGHLVEEQMRRARRSFLRQCLYRTPLEQWLRHTVGLAPRVWRETYR